MKVCLIQPAYSTDYSKSDYYYEEQIKLIEKCDDSMDIIVLPEATYMNDCTVVELSEGEQFVIE